MRFTKGIEQATRIQQAIDWEYSEHPKEMMQKEIESLPDTLAELEPVQRLNILCKLIPFVLPKVESVTHNLGEPENKGFKWEVPN